MTTRKLFGRSRKHNDSVHQAKRQSQADPFTSSVESYADDKLLASRDTNISNSALSTTSTASRTSRFFRRFGRQKPPPVPSLPPALVLDLDAGTAVPRSSDALDPTYSSGNAGAAGFKIQQQQQQPLPPPSAAAAIIAESNAAYAAAEAVPKPKGLQRKKMLEAMANARLDVSQTRDLVRMCGLQIRERGLDTSGLFRPFRIAESQDHVYHMIQLFLLSIDVSTYISVFPILPENALDHFGRNTASINHHVTSQQAKSQVARQELDKELRYAAPHDVVSVMKWGLRHMRLRTTDFSSKDSLEWYDIFVAAERESDYHARAIADLLHPSLPQATAELLSEVLDLMASVAAHSSTNHMPASALCQVLGFWLFGRIGVAHPPPTVDELIEAVSKTTAMAEHLLLAHIRSQAAVTFSMPLRLTELVERYPYIKPGQQAPCLPPAFAARPVPTLRIDLRSDNLIVSQAKPRSPSSTLADALNASASDHLQGGQGDMWATILTHLDATAEPGNKCSELLSDEDVRILRQVDQELARANQEQQAESEQHNSNSLLTMAADKAASPTAAPSLAELKAGRRRSQSLSDLRGVSFAATRPLAPLPESGSNTPQNASSPAPKSGIPKRKPVPLLDPQIVDTSDKVEVVNDTSDDSQRLPAQQEQDDLFPGGPQPSSSWRSFSEEGFGGMSTASSELSLSEFSPGHAQTLPSRRSNRSLYRVRSSASNGSRRKTMRNVMESVEAQTANAKTTHTVTSAALVHQLDTTFGVLWQDQLLDSSPCCRLPPMVFVQLNAKAAKLLDFNGQDAAQAPRYPSDSVWLLVVETIIPPRPPTPPTTGKGRWNDGDESDREERRSIFAPSIRSVRVRLRRVSTVIGNGVGFRFKEREHPPMPAPMGVVEDKESTA